MILCTQLFTPDLQLKNILSYNNNYKSIANIKNQHIEHQQLLKGRYYIEQI